MLLVWETKNFLTDIDAEINKEEDEYAIDNDTNILPLMWK